MNRSLSDRLLDPARRARNRLWARRARFGARAIAPATLPEPIHHGEADRGARLVSGVWDVCGHMIDLGGGPIWTARLPEPRLAEMREASGWIDDLAALGNRSGRSLAQAWVQDWIRRSGGGSGPGWQPEPTGLRAMRWVAHSAFLTEGLDATANARFWGALAAQQRYLARSWRHAAPGLGQMRALAGLVWTGRVAPHAGQAEAAAQLGALAAALVGPEGELGSRSPEDLAEMLALLIWTARLLEDADQPAAPEHLAAIVRMVPVLRPLRLGDGTLARFHGGGAGNPVAIDKALAELRLETQPRPRLPLGYARLTGGRLALLMDGAAPPAGVWAAGGHASTLAFELCVGRQPLVVNSGPGRILARRGRNARARRRRAARSRSTAPRRPPSSRAR